MLRRLLVLCAAACALVIGPSSGPAHAVPDRPHAQCGLPDGTPLWIDYAEGSVSFRAELFGKPGVVAASSGTAVPADLRRRGARTIYWLNKLSSLVGTTAKPADPASIAGAASRLVDRAIASSGCATPLIALNELAGPGTTTPWTLLNGQYRANVLALVQGIAARGARPYLLLPATPYTGGEALAWWQEVAKVADIVPEIYFQAPRIMRLGPILASRTMRVAYRNGISALTRIGVPASRLGFVIGFQSGRGTGGREGLQPTSRWLEFVKLQTLAARQVAGELGVGSVFTWGWGTFGPGSVDPDKPRAACVYLWARDGSLCDGVAAGADGFSSDLQEGQIALPAGVQCTLGRRTITTDEIDRLAAVTRDRDAALAALFGRMVALGRAAVGDAALQAAEQGLVDARFGGSRTAYLAELRRRRIPLALARGVLVDELARGRIAGDLTVTPATATEVRTFYSSYGSLPVRLVAANPGPAWLGGNRQGFALTPPAPAALLDLERGRPATLAGAEGPIRVTALGGPLPLSALPFGVAGPAVRRALGAFAREEAYDRWLAGAQDAALESILCVRDALPSPGAVDLTTYLPFLALDT